MKFTGTEPRRCVKLVKSLRESPGGRSSLVSRVLKSMKASIKCCISYDGGKIITM